MVEWSLDARDDLARIWTFHANRDEQRADRIIATIRGEARRQSERPRTGRPGVGDTREWLLRDLQYVLIYTIEDDGIRIARVLSTRERA